MFREHGWGETVWAAKTRVLDERLCGRAEGTPGLVEVLEISAQLC